MNIYCRTVDFQNELEEQNIQLKLVGYFQATLSALSVVEGRLTFIGKVKTSTLQNKLSVSGTTNVTRILERMKGAKLLESYEYLQTKSDNGKILIILSQAWIKFFIED